MKNFFVSMLGALAALVIFSVGASVLFFGFFIAIASMSGSKPAVSVEKGSYLVFDLSVNLNDAPPQLSGAALAAAFSGDDSPKTLQLRQVTHALRAAAKDGDIAGVFLHGQFAPEGYGTGFAALKELRAALLDFKASGKPILAYLDFAMLREAYVTSTASELVVDPYGIVFLPGLASQPMYFAGAFEKFGVGVQVTRVGKFKSAIEPFTRRDMSPESREQMQKLLDDLWADLRGDIAESRGITPDALQQLVDTEGMIRADIAVKNRLADRVAYRDEVIESLKTKTGRQKSKEPFKQVSMPNYIDAHKHDLVAAPAIGVEKKTGGKGRIAVVYAEGAIVDGKGEPGEVGGERFSRELRQLRQDEDVKAIVLRVNSPGGSAVASEHIQREMRLAKASKPVIVSMGTYAASGGYWISAYGDRIFAEPTTITGSIGVFGVQFDVQKLAGDLGITFDRVKTGKFADSLTIARPKTPEELAVLQRMVDWIYEEFIGKVSEGRALSREQVHEIGQGRVWSGAEAVKLKLVDEIGGLDAALAYAANKAGLGNNYELIEYPRKKEFAELIAEALQGMKTGVSTGDGRGGAVRTWLEELRTQAKVIDQFNDPRGVYARLPLEIISK